MSEDLLMMKNLLLLLGVHHPGLAVPHERLVVLDVIHGVMKLPTASAEVTEARALPAEVRPLTESAVGAESIFQVRIDLHLTKKGRYYNAQKLNYMTKIKAYLLGELGSLNLDEGS